MHRSLYIVISTPILCKVDHINDTLMYLLLYSFHYPIVHIRSIPVLFVLIYNARCSCVSFSSSSVMCTSFDIRNYWRGWNMLQCSYLLCKRGSNCKGTVIDQFTNASLIVKVSLYTILLCQYKWTSIFSFLLRTYSIYLHLNFISIA